MIKVSVIIPTFNRAHLVSVAISSVLNQSYRNLELILVDDGSTDHTWEVIEPFMGDKRLQYVLLKKNKGRSAARNLGVEETKGDFIMFLDSDDYLEADALEKLINLRYSYPQVNVFAGGYRLFKRKASSEYTIYKRGKDLFIQDVFLAEIKGMVLNIGNHIMHADLIKKKGIRFNEALDFAEDWEFILHAVKGESAIFIKETVLNVYRHDDNSAFTEIQKAIIDVINRFIIQLKNSEDTLEKNIYLNNFLLRLLMAYNRNGDKAKALRIFICLFKSKIAKKKMFAEFLYLFIPSTLLILLRRVQLQLKTYMNHIFYKQ